MKHNLRISCVMFEHELVVLFDMCKCRFTTATAGKIVEEFLPQINPELCQYLSKRNQCNQYSLFHEADLFLLLLVLNGCNQPSSVLDHFDTYHVTVH